VIGLLMASAFLLALWIAGGVRRSRLEELAGDVVQYGQHDPGCILWSTGGDGCDCGFDEAYKRSMELIQ
jgi:hypothetical protein